MARWQLPAGVQRESMEADILIVGGGSAGLSAASRIGQLIQEKKANGSLGSLPAEPTIVVLEKGMEVGAHSLSGAVLKPDALLELFPDYKNQGCPIECEVTHDEFHILGDSWSFKVPVTPPPFMNEGNLLVSISKFNRWLGTQAEALGVNIFPGFAAEEVIYEGDRVAGVITGDKGRDKAGNPKSNFEPGMEIRAKITIFAEGTRGSLFKKHAKKLNLRKNSNEEVFEEGVKELIQMPPGTVEPGQVIHTLGYPLSESIGGTFFYTLPGDRISLGLVIYLDSQDPLLDPHRELQKLKTHPWMQKRLAGGKVVAYGGKTLPAGGWYSMPELSGDGWMVCGDTASMVDVQKLKGIHLAMKSGMLAGEAAVEALGAAKTGVEALQPYRGKIENSFVKDDLYRVRNFHQALSKGVISSLPFIALQEITGGRGLIERMTTEKDSHVTETLVEIWGPEGLSRLENQLPKPDGKLFFDKLSSVYLTGTMHDEDSPNHLLLQNGDTCRSICEPKYKAPCVQFCPANVYEMIPSPAHVGEKELQINYTNCIHCKTCDIKCPFENIDWTVPEGGGGPRYTEV